MHQPSPVVFEDVGFAFPGQAPLLEGCSLVAEAGEVTAIVGQSGCGKSTLLRLAAGLLRPSQGSVLADDERRAFVFQARRCCPGARWPTTWRSRWSSPGARVTWTARSLVEVGLLGEGATADGAWVALPRTAAPR